MASRTITGAFDEFDENLNLDPHERRKAQARHQKITDCLVGAGLAAGTFLQGSFARKTMRRPLKDVDMVILLAEIHRPAWGGDGVGGPAAAMAAIQTAVAATFPGARFDVDDSPAHALQVTFPDCPFTFDLVPAFADPDGGEDIFIADRELDRWEWSNTRTLNRVISERNQATVGVFVHQVRMGKEFKADEPRLHELCGLAIESLAHAAIVKRMPHDRALLVLFEYAATAVLGKVLDPTGVDDLAAEWTTAQRAAYSQIFGSAANRAREAAALSADGEHAAAIEIWHDLLGEAFPEPAPQTSAQALAGLVAGSITSTGRAVTSQRAVQPNRPGRSWRTQ
jgi:hypothetical protein